MTMNGDKDQQPDTGAEGQGSTDSSLPFTPSKDDDTPVGDTDQHSKVPHDGTEEEARILREGAKQS